MFKCLYAWTLLRPGAVILKLDFKNAYNSAIRSAILREISSRCPHLPPIAQTIIADETLHWWFGEVGGGARKQGCRGDLTKRLVSQENRASLAQSKMTAESCASPTPNEQASPTLGVFVAGFKPDVNKFLWLVCLDPRAHENAVLPLYGGSPARRRKEEVGKRAARTARSACNRPEGRIKEQSER